LTKRLRKVFNKAININQSAFLEGQGILNCVVVADEVIDEAKRAKGECIITKIDFKKAYDSYL